MIRNKMLSVAIVAMAFVALAGVAEAGSRDYNLLPGTFDQFTADGSNFRLVDPVGETDMEVTLISGTTHSIKVACLLSSPVNCVGTVAWD